MPSKIRTSRSGCRWITIGVSIGSVSYVDLGSFGPTFPLLGYVAVGHQHRHVDWHVFDRLSHPKHSKSGRQSYSTELDELIRAMKAARTELVQMESLTDEELDDLQREFQLHRDQAIGNLERIPASRQSRHELVEIIEADQMGHGEGTFMGAFL